MSDELLICARSGAVPLSELAELIRKAHTKNIENGLHYGTAKITESELRREIKDSDCYVAYFGGKLVGTCTVSRRNIQHWYHSGSAAYIHLVAIDPNYQGKKIGTKLLEYALEKIKESNQLSFCFLTTAEKNYSLRKISEKLGFQLVWFSTYNTNDFYSVTYGKWIDQSPFSKSFIKFRYTLIKWMVKILYKPGRRLRFIP